MFDSTRFPVTELVQRRYERLPLRRAMEYTWHHFADGSVLTAWDENVGDPPVARHGDWVGVGEVRLDNRPELQRWGECEKDNLTDLEVTLRVVARTGTRYIAQFLGDFTFVVWRTGTGSAIAACDAFAVKKLFTSENNGLFAFGSRAEALALDERYELEYLTRLVALHHPARDLSVYAGVRRIPAGCFAVLKAGKLSLEQYWKARAFVAGSERIGSEQEAVEVCRELLVRSVRLRMNGRHTWAQLSGGLDSSSVVSLVQWLAERGDIPHGLAGTVTFVDRQGTGSDERRYSSAVVDRWRIPNELIIDAPTWSGDPEAAHVDEPHTALLVYSRERQMRTVVHRAGGRVLLTGLGGDQLFMGTMLFFADWMVTGRMGRAVREMARRAAVGRVSFWELAYSNAVVPLLPGSIRGRFERDEQANQPWLNRAILKRYGLLRNTALSREYAGRWGRKYDHATAMKINELPTVAGQGVLADLLDVRHPMMYRPLVEFSLRLPPDLRARPHAQRWVLRQSMRGILPEAIRTRVGKQDTGETLAHSLTKERARLLELLKVPILADLGVLDAARLRIAFDAATRHFGGAKDTHAQLATTLCVEAWLQMRSGGWPGTVMSGIRTEQYPQTT